MQAKQYYKVWFTDGFEKTAGLVLDTDRHPLTTTISDYSRLFPYWEAPRMKTICRTQLFDTFEQAFAQETYTRWFKQGAC